MTSINYIQQYFDENFYELGEDAVLRMNKVYNTPEINNVVRGVHTHCYGLAMMDDTDSIQYRVYYINGHNELSGKLLELDINATDRDMLLLAFSMNIADTFGLDPLEAFNTFQDATRSMCEQLDYMTITANELIPYQDKKPVIAAKNVKGILILPFLYHADLYKFLFGDLPPITPQVGDSFIYLMHNKRNNLVKIGKSRNPVHREKTLQAEEPEITMVAVWKVVDKLERHLHKLYKHKRLRGEWFKLTFKELKEIKGHVNDFIYKSI